LSDIDQFCSDLQFVFEVFFKGSLDGSYPVLPANRDGLHFFIVFFLPCSFLFVQEAVKNDLDLNSVSGDHMTIDVNTGTLLSVRCRPFLVFLFFSFLYLSLFRVLGRFKMTRPPPK
jgi:hypothetical protein